jgi:hypothetical protein
MGTMVTDPSLPPQTLVFRESQRLFNINIARRTAGHNTVEVIAMTRPSLKPTRLTRQLVLCLRDLGVDANYFTRLMFAHIEEIRRMATKSIRLSCRRETGSPTTSAAALMLQRS